MRKLLCILFAICYVKAAPAEDNGFNTLRSAQEEIISSYGYTIERHNVTTPDGYILGVYHMPYPRYQTSADEDRPVVFLMHGLFGQFMNYFALEPELGFGYNLADAGFDVWLGNARGNVHSRAHTTLNPDSEEDKNAFFDFSWEEIGMIDLPAMIDYVLEYTGKEKLHYIGMSQGGTTFLVMGSMRPEYNDKLESVHLLAGVGYMEHFPNEELKSVAQLTDIIYAFAFSEGFVEFTPELLELIGIDIRSGSAAPLCIDSVQFKHICGQIGVRNLTRDTNTTAVDDMENQFGGGSLKQMVHYGQNIRDGLFRRFHHGTAINQEIYGSGTPPVFDLSRITCNVVMHYSLSDVLLDERDVIAMANDMPNCVPRLVARETFEHSDYVTAVDAKELVTDWIIDAIIEDHNREATSEENQEEEDSEISEEVVDPNAPVEETVTGSAVITSTNMILCLAFLSILYIVL